MSHQAEAGQAGNELDLGPAPAMTPLVSDASTARHGIFADAVVKRWASEAQGSQQAEQIDAAVHGFNLAVADEILLPGTADGVRQRLLELMAANGVGLARVAHTLSVGDGHRFRVDTLEVTFHGALVSHQPLSLDEDNELHRVGDGWATTPSPLVREVAATPMDLPGARAARRRFSPFAPQAPPLGPDPLPLAHMAVEASGDFLEAMERVSAGLSTALDDTSNLNVSGQVPLFIHSSASPSLASPTVTVNPERLSVRDETRMMCRQVLNAVEPISKPLPARETIDPPQSALDIRNAAVEALLDSQYSELGFQRMRCYVRTGRASITAATYDVIVPTWNGHPLIDPADSWGGNPKLWLGSRHAAGPTSIRLFGAAELPLTETDQITDRAGYSVYSAAGFPLAKTDSGWRTRFTPDPVECIAFLEHTQSFGHDVAAAIQGTSSRFTYNAYELASRGGSNAPRRPVAAGLGE